MKKRTFALFLVGITAVSLLSFTLGLINGAENTEILECPKPDIDLKCPAPKINITKRCPEPRVQTSCPECDKGFFKRMLESQSRNFIYKENEYDCTEFAKELKRRLENKGFDADSRQIRADCDNSFWEGTNCKEFDGVHRIVKIEDLYVEATTGDIIDPQDYGAYNVR